jgi:hypothetical protein
MPRYSFRIARGEDVRQQETSSDLPDNQAAKREAVAIFSGLGRSFAHDIEANPASQIETGGGRLHQHPHANARGARR